MKNYKYKIIPLLALVFFLFSASFALAESAQEQILRLADDVIAGKIELDNSMTPAKYKEQETWYDFAIKGDPLFKAAALSKVQTKTIDIAVGFLKNNRPQEAIWTLERGQQFELAQMLEQKIRQAMVDLPLEVKEEVDGGLFGTAKGISGAMLGKVGGIPVVAKLPEQDNNASIKGEAWSYRVNQILGFNLIPISLVKKSKDKNYSIVIKIQKASPTNNEYKNYGYDKGVPDIYILDYLLDNADRHGRNSLYGVDGRIIAIDHNRVYGIWADEKFHHYDPNFIPSPRLHRNIKSMDLKRFQELLSPYAPKHVVQFISDRLKEVQAALPAVPEVSGSMQRPLPQ